jgi:LPPG:FO 2-phospho-L-lactate transferase
LAAGLQEVLPRGALTVIVNTGDDFEHWGLTVCPDIDTVLYNLAGIHNPQTGWGRAGETFTTLDAMDQIGGESWFRIGNLDLATHLRRSEWLRQGATLSDVTDGLRRSLGIPSLVAPMSDQPVRTLVHTDEGDLPFQHYFVRRRCEPCVIDLTYVGADEAKLSDLALSALQHADAIVFCPSNPYLSIDPILSVAGVRRFIRKLPVPKIAVSPIVGGRAIKGPAAKMMRELGKEVSARTVAEHLDGVLTGFVVDLDDALLADEMPMPTIVTSTVMVDMASKVALAHTVLDFALGQTVGHRQPQPHRPMLPPVI